MELAEARAVLTKALELAEESGAIESRGWFFSPGRRSISLEGHLEQAEEAAEQAKRLSSEAGAVWAVARALNIGAWVAWGAATSEKGEKRFRESIRLLKPIGDRAALCESQRGLAELLLERGRVEEAERLALEAVETVGSAGPTSRATTARLSPWCARRRGATTRPRSCSNPAVDAVTGTDFREVSSRCSSRYAEFLRERAGRTRLRSSKSGATSS